MTRIRREWHDQFEALAHDVVDTWKKCTKLPRYRCQEEWPHELLNSIAKGLVDVFVSLVHACEEIGVRTCKATRRLTHRRVAAQKKFVSARTTQKRMNHNKRTNNTEHPSEKSLRPRRKPRPRGGRNKEWYKQLYESVWKR